MIIQTAMIVPVIILALVCGSIAYTVSEQEIFRPLREFVKPRSAWLHKLISCGYCFGHWTSFGLVIIYQPRIFSSALVLIDYFLTALLIAWLSGFQWRLMVLFGKVIRYIHVKTEGIKNVENHNS